MKSLFASSVIFHPCKFGPLDSGPAFSGSAVWSFIFQSCIIRSCVFRLADLVLQIPVLHFWRPVAPSNLELLSAAKRHQSCLTAWPWPADLVTACLISTDNSSHRPTLLEQVATRNNNTDLAQCTVLYPSKDYKVVHKTGSQRPKLTAPVYKTPASICWHGC